VQIVDQANGEAFVAPGSANRAAYVASHFVGGQPALNHISSDYYTNPDGSFLGDMKDSRWFYVVDPTSGTNNQILMTQSSVLALYAKSTNGYLAYYDGFALRETTTAPPITPHQVLLALDSSAGEGRYTLLGSELAAISYDGLTTFVSNVIYYAFTGVQIGCVGRLLAFNELKSADRIKAINLALQVEYLVAG